MAKKRPIKSVEPLVADLVNGWLRGFSLDYKLEQESLNSEIDTALANYASKNGGGGGNRPDVKLLLKDSQNNNWPILIEYKGYKDKLEKVDENGTVINKTAKNEPHYGNINAYAVNGAVHYANALMQYTNYKNIIAIGVTGYKDEADILQIKTGVYVVSGSNLGYGQRVGEYSDLSFLEKSNFDSFVEVINELELSKEQKELLRQQREKEIDVSLTKLNNDIYQDEKGLGENDRVYLVAASIIATIGIPNQVSPLRAEELISSEEEGERDGDKLIRKVNAFLSRKGIPTDKKDLVVRTLQNTLLTENINKPVNGESQLKRVFSKIVDDLGIYYKIGLNTDFTGKLFNEMYSWLGFSQDKLNDVVLTPSYVATLLVKLARVNRDSYVWDFATGSAGLLVAAMNEMLDDAKANIHSPELLYQKEAEIKAKQLLGLEVLPSIYMLAILNMIMMGDGSSNIINEDSLTEFTGKYGYGKTDENFPATAFVLNPPYSAEGNGMVFVKRALSMMDRGYASIIIQGSAGSGKATEINKEILKHNRLLASIKMPSDLFVGKSSVQTYIYVFQVGEVHENDYIVKFIDFTNDGYTRSNRKKSSNNLRNINHAKERYQELVDLVKYDRSKLKYISESDYYEGHIDVNRGDDWNQTAPIDLKPELKEFNNTVSNYLTWEISNLLQKQSDKVEVSLNQRLESVEWGKYKLIDLFGKSTRGKRLKSSDRIPGTLPFVTAGEVNEGVSAFIGNDVTKFSSNTVTIDMFGSAKYRSYKYGCDDHVAVVHTENIPPGAAVFVASAIHKSSYNGQFNYGRNFYAKDANELVIELPKQGDEPDYDFMASFIVELELERLAELENYLEVKRIRKP